MRVVRGKKSSFRKARIQRGAGLAAHNSRIRIQRGRGLGSFFAKMLPWVRPILGKIGPKLLTSAKTLAKSPLAKKVLKVAKTAAKTGGTEIVGELIKGNKIEAKKVAKQHVGEARNKIGSLIKESGQPSKVMKGPPGLRKTQKKKKKKKKKIGVKTKHKKLMNGALI